MGSELFFALKFISAFLITVPLEAITVNPSLCPTNKIAPHKRIANWGYGKGRTFGAFYDLLVPGNPQYEEPNDLQEQPQEDDPDDCGEIEDYDENDLSSITPQGNRRQGHRDSRGFFRFYRPSNYPQRPPSNYPERPPSNYPERPPTNFPQRPPPDYPQRPPPDYPQRPPPDYPQRPPPDYPQRPPPDYPQRPPSNYPQRPPFPPTTTRRPQGPSRPPTRPPYWSGGFFGSNDYRPPLQQYPSGLLGNVVGVPPMWPTIQDESTTSRMDYHRLRTSTPAPNTMHPTRRPRSRNINENGVFGSFVDLLFK